MKSKLMTLLLLMMAMMASAMTNGDEAQVKMSSIFANNMVLQRNASVPVWGKAQPGANVKVTLSDKQGVMQSLETTADAEGRWEVSLSPREAGGPFSLSANDKTIEVWFGDVFLFSGQSNQELPIRRCMDNWFVKSFVKDYVNADVHIMKTPQQFNYVDPQDEMNTTDWVTINPQTAPGIAALSYFVGREIQEYAKVPVGIINSSVGGTKVESWMSKARLSQFDEYKAEMAKRKYNWRGWVDSVRTAENTAADAWEKRLAREDKTIGEWKKKGYNFSTWKKVDIFKPFYDNEKPHGSYWFRNVFNLPKAVADACGQYTLRLGAMKDADSVFVNGHFVGNTTYEYPPRNYNVPAEYLHAGNNEVVVHLISQKGRPNFTSGKSYELAMGGGGTIPLDKGWTMKVGLLMEPKPTQTYFVDAPTGLYNAMIHPLGHLPFRGMVWYQGEANVGKPYHYKEYMQAMVEEWREKFQALDDAKEKGIPFVQVQLAGYMGTHEGAYDSGWCDVRDEQRAMALETPNVALATAIDCGEWNDIHPQDKPTISHRVALQLRRLAYGDNVIAEGPCPVSARQNGDDIIITFCESTGELKPFKDDYAETTGAYEVTIHKVNATALYSVKEGKVRYAHDDFPHCTIYNTAGLPAPQFSIEIK